ncbi:MAG: hypothetical protein K2Y25_15655, partial [Pseudomonadaceae bacterium]|nr:hypothetical protein [Pseudomonadaceae bacterium]
AVLPRKIKLNASVSLVSVVRMMHPWAALNRGGLSDPVKTTALGYAALKTGSKSSFTARKLRFFRLFLPCLTFARYVFTQSDVPPVWPAYFKRVI